MQPGRSIVPERKVDDHREAVDPEGRDHVGYDRAQNQGQIKAANPIAVDKMPNPRACRIWNRNQPDASGRGVTRSRSAIGQKIYASDALRDSAAARSGGVLIYRVACFLA